MKNIRMMVALLSSFLFLPMPAMPQNVSRMNAGILAKSANYNLACADAVKLVTFSAAATATLPAPAGCGTVVFQVKNISSNAIVTVNTASGTINGVSSIPLNPNQEVDVYNDGTNYVTTDNASLRVCDIIVGDTSGSAVTDAQLGPQKRICQVPGPAVVLQVSVSSDAGTPNVIVGRSRCTTFTSNICTAETRVNLTSAALAAATGGFEGCSNAGGTTGYDGGTTCSATLQNTAINAGDYLELVSGTAGGTAKLVTIHVIFIVLVS